jgi:hypothetical protein
MRAELFLSDADVSREKAVQCAVCSLQGEGPDSGSFLGIESHKQLGLRESHRVCTTMHLENGPRQAPRILNLQKRSARHRTENLQ